MNNNNNIHRTYEGYFGNAKNEKIISSLSSEICSLRFRFSFFVFWVVLCFCLFFLSNCCSCWGWSSLYFASFVLVCLFACCFFSESVYSSLSSLLFPIFFFFLWVDFTVLFFIFVTFQLVFLFCAEVWLLLSSAICFIGVGPALRGASSFLRWVNPFLLLEWYCSFFLLLY